LTFKQFANENTLMAQNVHEMLKTRMVESSTNVIRQLKIYFRLAIGLYIGLSLTPCIWCHDWTLLPYLTLPYLQDGQALTPAQRWGRICSAQCASPNVTTRLQVVALKP